MVVDQHEHAAEPQRLHPLIVKPARVFLLAVAAHLFKVRTGGVFRLEAGSFYSSCKIPVDVYSKTHWFDVRHEGATIKNEGLKV